jgi:hypothetical protein
MTELEAIRLVSLYRPHDLNASQASRERVAEFDEAISVLHRLLAEADEMEGCLLWYVREDDTNEGMPSNEFWIEGKRRAMRALKMEET